MDFSAWFISSFLNIKIIKIIKTREYWKKYAVAYYNQQQTNFFIRQSFDRFDAAIQMPLSCANLLFEFLFNVILWYSLYFMLANYSSSKPFWLV